MNMLKQLEQQTIILVQSAAETPWIHMGRLNWKWKIILKSYNNYNTQGVIEGSLGATRTCFLPVLCSGQAAMGSGLLICILLISMGKQGENWHHTAVLPSVKFSPRVYPFYPWIITLLLPLPCFYFFFPFSFLTGPNCHLFLVKANNSSCKAIRDITHLAGRKKLAQRQERFPKSCMLGICIPITDKVSHQSKGVIFVWSNMLNVAPWVQPNISVYQTQAVTKNLRLVSMKLIFIQKAEESDM